jgi:hypothetical protein
MNVPDSRIDGRSYSISPDNIKSELQSETLPVRIVLLLTALALSYTLCLPLILINSHLAIPACWIVCLLCALTVLTTAKKLSVILIVFILGFFPISYTGQPIITALLFGSVICLGGTAATLSAGRGFKAVLAFLLPLLSYLSSVMLTLDPICSLASLILYPPVFAMGISCRVGKDKKTSIIITASLIVATIVGFTAIFIQSTYGGLTQETISAACSDLSQSYIKMMEEALLAAGQVNAHDIAVFTSMCMCWSGYLSTHVAMMDSLKCRELTGKAILYHTIGGICAGIASNWLYTLITLIL